MIAKCPEIAVFTNLRVINKTLATHPLRQYPSAALLLDST
jgi:hypothetical protein